jgi:hypothetical protein
MDNSNKTPKVWNSKARYVEAQKKIKKENT